jgi:hypothetical protein
VNYDRAQEAVRGGTGTVMYGVAGGDPVQPPAPDNAPAMGQPTVNANIVYKQVRRAVPGHTGTRGDQPGAPRETTEGHKTKGKAGER